MALLMTGLWQLAIAVIIFFNISAALPSVERTFMCLQTGHTKYSSYYTPASCNNYDYGILVGKRGLVRLHQRQVELKLMHDAGMRREYEKTVKLLQEMLDYKRSVPNPAEAKAASMNNHNNDSWNSEEKLIKLKSCLLIVQNLDARFPVDAKDTAPGISRAICQLIVELNEAASGTPADENQE